MLRILVIEDDKILGDLLSTYLQQNNFETKLARDGQEAFNYIQEERFDLILLDLILPKISGDQLLQYVRDSDNYCPIIVITSETSQESELTCYKNGTNIFHRKPINCKLLIYQIRSVLKEQLNINGRLVHKDLQIDTNNKDCYIKGFKVKLSPLEYSTLAYLLDHKNKLVTKKDLSLFLYSDYDQKKFNNLDTIVCRIRKKLDTTVTGREFKIIASKGFGYRI